jgi:hypothetical protein
MAENSVRKWFAAAAGDVRLKTFLTVDWLWLVTSGAAVALADRCLSFIVKTDAYSMPWLAAITVCGGWGLFRPRYRDMFAWATCVLVAPMNLIGCLEFALALILERRIVTEYGVTGLPRMLEATLCIIVGCIAWGGIRKSEDLILHLFTDLERIGQFKWRVSLASVFHLVTLFCIILAKVTTSGPLWFATGIEGNCIASGQISHDSKTPNMVHMEFVKYVIVKNRINGRKKVAAITFRKWHGVVNSHPHVETIREWAIPLARTSPRTTVFDTDEDGTKQTIQIDVSAAELEAFLKSPSPHCSAEALSRFVAESRQRASSRPSAVTTTHHRTSPRRWRFRDIAVHSR